MERPLAYNKDTLEQLDQQTLSQLRRGQFMAMEPLVQRYQDRLYGTIFRIVNNTEDAADLVQETFVKALENLTGFEGKSSLYTWLYRIAVNLALSQRRRQRYRNAVSLDGDVRDEQEDSALNQQAAALRRQLAQDTEVDPAVSAERHLDHQRIMEMLPTLDGEHRVVIVLRDVEGCDYEQIAEILEVPIGTIKSRLFRARSALRDAVETKTNRAPDTDGHYPARKQA